MREEQGTRVSRWEELGGPGGAAYRARFDRLAATGTDVHGEATLCATLVAPGARVLDAGCGTGRVAVRLADLGYECVGVDADLGMLAQADDPRVRWHLVDLSDPQAVGALGTFELVVAAGNVIPLLAAGTEAIALQNLAGCLEPDGRLVTGFGLDTAHLPLAHAPFGLAEYDAWCTAAGLRLTDRFATWDRAPYDGGGYAVSVHGTMA